MEVSSFLSQIGLGNLDIGYILLALVILTIILIILNIVSLVKISNLKKCPQSGERDYCIT